MRIPKNGMEMDVEINFGSYWYGYKKRYGKVHYYKSCNCRFDNTCDGTIEITEDEFHQIATKYATLFK